MSKILRPPGPPRLKQKNTIDLTRIQTQIQIEVAIQIVTDLESNLKLDAGLDPTTVS
jgi:ABC-type transporter Mla subunit MlaD